MCTFFIVSRETNFIKCIKNVIIYTGDYMNYKALYRKYRPDNFDDLYGQEIIKTILQNSIKNNKINHAFLFFGPRGTGKTSTAKIYAKLINCLNISDAKACGECENCKKIEKNTVDIIEMDAASNNGVEEIRNIRNKIDLVPTELKYKVYIIDEIQMLTKEAFDALLKTLEEPPKHVIFIMATTEIKKVPDTIVSRCQVLEFKKISKEIIKEKLEYICLKENIEYEEDALLKIAELSAGGLRDSLTILDKAIAYSDRKKINIDLIYEISNTVSFEKLKPLANSLVEKNEDNFIEEYKKIVENNLDIITLIKNLLKYYESNMIDNIDYQLITLLNELINKISSVEIQEFLFKVYILKYFKENTEIKKEIKIIENTKKDENQIEEALFDSKKDDKKLTEEEIKIKINNCFVEAKKINKLEYEKKLKEEIIKNNDKKVITLLKKEIKMASLNTIIYSCNQKEKELFDSEKNVLEKIFSKILNKKINLIFLETKEWEEETKKYIENKKIGILPKYIEETNIKNENKINIFDKILEIE